MKNEKTMCRAADPSDAVGRQDLREVRNQQAPNQTITADDLDNLRHMLGVSEKCRKGYRNYFVAGKDNVASMERLRAVGFTVKNDSYQLSADPCYHATVEGARAVGLRSLP